MPAQTTIQKKLSKTALSVLVRAFVVVTLAVVVLNVLLSKRSQAASVARIEASLSTKGSLLVSNSSEAISTMIEGYGIIQIRDLVASAVEKDPDVVYGLFMPSDSAIPSELADESDPATREGVLVKAAAIMRTPIALWARSSNAAHQRITGIDDGQTIDFASPVGGKEAPSGWIVYRLSTRAMVEAIDMERRKTRDGLLAVIGIVLLLGTGSLLYSLYRFKKEAESLSRPVRELARAAELIRGGDFRTPVSVESDDEIGDLASTFETMRQTVRTYTEHLEDLVSEKMRQVRDILDNVEQGLIVVDFEGNLSPEHSRAATEILGVGELGNIREALQLSPSQHEDFLSWLGLVHRMHATMRWEKLTKVAPVQELEIEGPDDRTRFVRLRYQRMYNKDREVEKIMVLAQDETENRRVETIMADEKERHENEVKTILGLVNNLPEVIREFMRDSRARIDALEDLCRSMLDRSVAARARFPVPPTFAPSPEEIAKIFRDFHTVKGNAGTYGFERLARLAHQGEDLLEDLKPPIAVRTAMTLRAILDKLDEMDKAYEEILATERKLMGGGGGDGDVLVQISERKIEHLRRLASAVRDTSRLLADSESARTLAEACERIRDVPLPKLADKYRGMVRRLSERLGKRIHLEVDPRHLEVDPGFFSPLDEALVHLFRNAVDHGIETPETRAAAGKAEQGTIRLEVLLEEERIVVTVSDDGAGIDAGAVAAKAVEHGVVSAAEVDSMGTEEKVMLVFESGLSTAPSVTEVSGRGVGMSAVRDSIEALGGGISISTEIGKGTSIVFQIPRYGT